MAVFPELILNKLFPVQKLTNHTLAAYEVAVRLNPHSAFDFPSTLGNSLFNFLVYFGRFVLQILINLRLTGHKFIFWVSVHKHKNRSKRTLHLFFGLRVRPQPRDVNMSMTNPADNRRISVAYGFVKNIVHIPERLVYAVIVCVTSYIT